jgi:GNAT superfamily N-acetyltransferase
MKIPTKFSESDIEYKLLSLNNDLSNFYCSDQELTDFLKEDALNNQQRNFSVTHLAYWNKKIVGYFSLITDCISVENIDSEDRQDDIIYRKYPALKIARLATDKEFEHRGIGTLMMDQIFYITFTLSKTVGCRTITVDSKHKSFGFYQKNGFKKATCRARETIPMYLDFYSAVYQK